MSTEIQTIGFDGSIRTEGIRITGTMVNYYMVCQRQLWLHSRYLGREDSSELVQLGALLHKQSFSREQKEVLILGQIQVDHTSSGETLIVHEVKKSGSQHKAARAQLLFYMLTLELLGVHSKGELHFLKSHQKQAVLLDEQNRLWLHKILRGVARVVKSPAPPPVPAKAPCRRCAYHDYCVV